MKNPRVYAFPQDRNPYQSLLHQALAAEGVRVDYLPMATRSQTLNLLLLPAQLVRGRLAGIRILHLHWVYTFSLPGAARWPALRILAELWFHLVLFTGRALGIRLIWTAHNVLPHDRVFWNDRAARRRLLLAADGVICHDDRTPAALAALLAPADAATVTEVVPHGSYADWYATREQGREDAREALRLPQSARVLLFFGRVTVQKGVLELVDCYRTLYPTDAPDAPLLVIAGGCSDPALEHQLTVAAEQLTGRLLLDLRFVPDPTLALYLCAADAVVLPFRQVTTSGSAVMAMTAGRAVVLPDLAAFADVPNLACLRYEPTSPDGLRQAIAEVVERSDDELTLMGSAGRAAMTAVTWSDAAARTASLYREVIGPRRSRRPRTSHEQVLVMAEQTR